MSDLNRLRMIHGHQREARKRWREGESRYAAYRERQAANQLQFILAATAAAKRRGASLDELERVLRSGKPE